jgi:hypothetical protein
MFDNVGQISQKILLAELRQLYAADPVRYASQLNDFGFRCYSQFEEDGLFLFILAAIGFSSKRVVEICAGNGLQCMSANLIINHGFDGLLFDGSKDNVILGTQYFREHKDTFLIPPKFVHAWITAENVNDLLIENGFEGEVDLLAIDLDGNDYWVWNAISAIQPRIVVIEYRPQIPSDVSRTIPYNPNFSLQSSPPDLKDFFGASLLAIVRLARSKG